MKKSGLIALILAASCCGLASCGKGGSRKIAIGLYTLTGNHKDALTAFLAPIEKSENVKFTYFETGYDGDSLLTAVNQQIAAGAQGIITTMDGGESILEACQDANVWYSGYLCDFESSYEELKNQDYYLGTAVDGAYRGTAWGEHIAERVIADGKKNIATIKFPAYAYPHQSEMDTAFRAKITEYNSTAAEADKITVSEETYEMPFFGFDVQTYLSSYEGIDAIYAMCGGVDSIYPGMTDAQKASIKLYTAGYNIQITSANDFGPDHCIQEMVYANVEGIAYPLALMLNELDGQQFADKPATAQRVETSQVIIQTGDDLDFVQAHSIYHTANAKDAFLDTEAFSNLLAKNGGTHAKLVETVQSMTLADLRALNQ